MEPNRHFEASQTERTSLMLRIMLLLCLSAWGLLGTSQSTRADDAAQLPQTAPLTLNEPLDVVMVRGINRFAERELVRAAAERTAPWLKQPADSQQGAQERQAAREQLKKIIGLPEMDGGPAILAFSQTDPSHPQETVPGGNLFHGPLKTCQWNAFSGVTGRGLITIPQKLPPQQESPILLTVVIPDAMQTPEESFRLWATDSKENPPPLARILADHNVVVLAPLLIDRDFANSGHPRVRWTNIPHRELLYRTSFEMGLHPVGYEIAKVLTGIRAVRRELAGRPVKTVVIGTGEGGLIALMAAATFPEEIDGAMVRGYFQKRDRVYEEPIYRNLFGQLNQFGDAEIASLIAPRPLVIDPCDVTEIDGPVQTSDRQNFAAPGAIKTPDPASVQEEFERASHYYQQAGATSALTMIPHVAARDHQWGETQNGFRELVQTHFPGVLLDLEYKGNISITPPLGPTPEFLKQRMKTQVEELVDYSQRAMHSSQALRKILWKDVPTKDVKQTVEALKPFRELVQDTFIGRLPAASLPPRPRSRKVLEEDGYVGYEVVLDLHPGAKPASGAETLEEDAGIIAGGILLIPKDLKADEKRPVVVFQHGLEGTPMDTITTDKTERAFAAYQAASVELVKQGYIVYAPQNPYRGFDEFRSIQRKSNPIGRSLFSYIIQQHQTTLDWLASLSYVDPSRIAFYGISYGGKTAVRVPPLLVGGQGHAGYCLSICSADFNEWILKNASADQPASYVFTKEYEIFEWNMAHIANYAELTWLMIPRPFMVERGLDDGVAPDDWVAAEFARARRPYFKLGIDEKISMGVFDGPHMIHGTDAYAFLSKHLKWPN